MNDDYAAPMQEVDFTSIIESARSSINDWVEAQTHQKIRELIPSGGLTNDTRLVLVNALYLKVPWQDPFDKEATQPQPFHLSRKEAPDVATMRRTATMNYVEEDGMQVVALDYLGRDLQCLVILPAPEQTVEALAATLTARDFTRWARLKENKHYELVSLHLPKFEIRGASLPLGETMRALGIKSAFDEPSGSANFDRIAPRQPNQYLALSKVYHKTFISLDEQGTEASAATAISMVALTGMRSKTEPLVVRIDRPFLFAIQHRASGVCLFLGRVTDPR